MQIASGCLHFSLDICRRCLLFSELHTVSAHLLCYGLVLGAMIGQRQVKLRRASMLSSEFLIRALQTTYVFELMVINFVIDFNYFASLFKVTLYLYMNL